MLYKCFVFTGADEVTKAGLIGNFHPLEVVGRGSETQLQVGEKNNFNHSASKGLYHCSAELFVLIF